MKKISCCGATNKHGRYWVCKGGEPRQVRLLGKELLRCELDQLIEQTREQQPRCEWIFHPAMQMAMVEVRSLTLRASSWPLPEGKVGVFLENKQPLVDTFPNA